MPDNRPSLQRSRWQFSLATLLLLMALVSVLASVLAGLVRRQFVDDGLPPGFFVIMAVAAPLAMLLVVSLVRRAARLFSRR